METQIGYTNFGDIARGCLRQQCQYASRYIWGTIPGYPALNEGLRFNGKAEDYHFIEIHKDDVAKFIKRYNQYQEDALCMSPEDLYKKYKIAKE